ncbi:MAG: hypothetical protein HY015_04595 [Bacteroidetes bacterium]|nr:hypothetical protein [Bacteroidota bacterium]MBI3482239.1 hypothetical protein [Bacteroidota bacterium]
MVIAFDLSQRVACSIDRTFSFLSNLANMPRWNYFIQSVTQVSQGTVGKGTVFKQKRPSDLFYVKIVEFNPPNKIMAQLQPPGPDLLYSFTLTSLEGQTEVLYSWRLNVEHYSILKYVPRGSFKNWIISIIEKQILTKTKPAVAQNFYKLKTLLETGQVILQDGRTMTLPDGL